MLCFKQLLAVTTFLYLKKTIIGCVAYSFTCEWSYPEVKIKLIPSALEIFHEERVETIHKVSVP